MCPTHYSSCAQQKSRQVADFCTRGGGEIRTPEGLPPGGFQDHCTRPTMRLLRV